MSILLGIILFLLFLGGYFVRSSVFGQVPKTEQSKEFEKSSSYNKEKGRFENRQSHLHAQMNKKNFHIPTFLETMSEWRNNKRGVPDRALPSMAPDLEKFLACDEDDVKFIWLGHSTFLLRMAQKTILVDPVFSSVASPLPFLARRFQKPPLSLEDLPDIDFVLISHDHYDHLDMNSIKFFKDKHCLFIAPLGLSSHLMHWGIEKERIEEADWWEGIEIKELTFTATPSQHFSGRDLFNSNKTLWASWVIASDDHRVFFSGDSGYDTHFKEIGQHLGPFDLAFIETGQYNPKWQEVHMLPRDSAQAFIDLKAKYYVPIHWGMFELSLHAWDEPIIEISRYAKELTIPLLTPQLGELVDLKTPETTQGWWKSS